MYPSIFDTSLWVCVFCVCEFGRCVFVKEIRGLLCRRVKHFKMSFILEINYLNNSNDIFIWPLKVNVQYLCTFDIKPQKKHNRVQEQEM